MKRTVKTGAGVLAVGVILGAILMKFLPNLNFGLGGGAGSGTQVVGPSGEGTAPEVNSPAAVDSPTADIPEPGDPPRPRSASGDVVHIMVDERDFLYEAAGGAVPTYQPIALEKLVEMARIAKGNEDGVRVSISRRGSARAKAEIELRDRLLEAGLSEEAILWQDGPPP